MVFRLGVLILFFTLSISAFADRNICDHIVVKDGKISLDKNEKILICGSSKSGDGWREIPLPQAQYQLTVKLQNMGYLQSKFQRTGDSLEVWMGPRQTTKNLRVTGQTELLDAGKKRKIRGYAMEPTKLDEVQQWAETTLRRQGYACPKIKVTGERWSDSIVVDVQGQGVKKIGKFETTGLEGLAPETINRFQAFKIGDTYDLIEPDLTANRMITQGLFQSAYVATKCPPGTDEADLHLTTTVGKPRVLRIGIGASTEDFPFVDFRFQNSKLDNKASSYNGRIYASNRTQELQLGSELYLLPNTTRSFLGPRFDVKRQKEDAYEYFSAKLGVDLGRNWDAAKKRFSYTIGPTFNYSNTVVGLGPTNAKYLSLDGMVSVMSHAYEEFIGDQNEGWTGSFGYRGQRVGLGSPINVDRYQLDFKHLWNLGAYSPPLFVLASRFQGIAVNTRADQGDPANTVLPVDYRVFYGGDENLRGFSRKSLDNYGLGYLTAVSIGFELRLIEELPYHLQPFLLWDGALLGQQPMLLDQPIYTSPGIGIRWASPFGTLRGSAAHGTILHGDATSDRYAQEWVYFVSFGQEF